MPYPTSSQLTKDIDFFIQDARNRKLHFASAGGFLPEMIVLKYKSNQRVQKALLALDIMFEFEINPNLDNIIDFSNNEMRQIYLRDFIFYAQRGLYSFDKTNIADFNDPSYHLVASPVINDENTGFDYNELFEELKIKETLNLSSNLNILRIFLAAKS